MNAKHTPGPWKIRAKRLGSVVMIDAAPHVPGVIAQVCATTGEDGTNLTADVRNEANARLIAAAPDLLASLREFVALYDGCRDMLGAPVAAKLARAEAVIAKAEGR
jgi:hypothetical protein